ncbi:MAG: hypothetical protein R3264_08495, partial [Anaerolineae bacterium]|nr:hypothetical protein [Anaerolineae bacterium]
MAQRNTTSSRLSFRDLSIKLKLVVVVVCGLGIAIALATFLVSTAIDRFENRVSETQLAEEQRITAIHFASEVRDLEEIATLTAANEVLTTALAIGDEASLNTLSATFKVQHDLDHFMVVGTNNQPLVDQPLDLSSTLSALLETTLYRNDHTTLLFTEQGWL